MSDEAKQKVMRQEVTQMGDDGAQCSASVMGLYGPFTCFDAQTPNKGEHMSSDGSSLNMRGCKR